MPKMLYAGRRKDDRQWETGERVIEFIDSCDGDDSFDGDFFRLRPVPLTGRQAKMVSRILLGEKVKVTVAWTFYTGFIISMLLFSEIESLFLACDVVWMPQILQKWAKDRCSRDDKAYAGTVRNKFCLHGRSERKHFTSIQLSCSGKVIYKAKMSRSVARHVDIGDRVLVVPLSTDVVVIPRELS